MFKDRFWFGLILNRIFINYNFSIFFLINFGYTRWIINHCSCWLTFYWWNKFYWPCTYVRICFDLLKRSWSSNWNSVSLIRNALLVLFSFRLEILIKLEWRISLNLIFRRWAIIIQILIALNKAILLWILSSLLTVTHSIFESKALLKNIINKWRINWCLFFFKSFSQSLISLFNFWNVDFLSLKKLSFAFSNSYFIHALNPVSHNKLALRTFSVEFVYKPPVVEYLWLLNNILNQSLSMILIHLLELFLQRLNKIIWILWLSHLID